MAVFEVRECLLCSIMASKRCDACPLRIVKQPGERRRIPAGDYIASSSLWLMALLGHAQAKRLQNFRTKGETGLLGMAPFDPLGLRDDYKRQSEVRPCCS